MAFELKDVAAFKIHPAIGVARLANNDDCYEFFCYEKQRKEGFEQAQKLQYMSMQNNHHWVMRQAVQFKIFAYAKDGSELGELTSDRMGRLNLRATWSAHVANRKLNNRSKGRTPAVEATASASGKETARLEGDNPFYQGKKVWLGDITGEGLFIPPKGGVYRKTTETVINSYSDDCDDESCYQADQGIQDTTSDGSVSVTLEGAGDRPVIPACVIVAPQQHSPDVNPGDIQDEHNKDFVKNTRNELDIPDKKPPFGSGYQMDLDMMNTINGQYAPGVELCLDPDQNAVLPKKGDDDLDKAVAFYQHTETEKYIHQYEIRPRYKAKHDNGLEYGALTAGLCSAWQTDLTACLDYWTAEFPHNFNGSTKYSVAHKPYKYEGKEMVNPEDLNAYMDMMAIGRLKNPIPKNYDPATAKNKNAILKLKETERTEQDVPPSATPTKFDLEPSSPPPPLGSTKVKCP